MGCWERSREKRRRRGWRHGRGRTHGRESEVEEGVFGGEDEVQAGKDRDKEELTPLFYFPLQDNFEITKRSFPLN